MPSRSRTRGLVGALMPCGTLRGLLWTLYVGLSTQGLDVSSEGGATTSSSAWATLTAGKTAGSWEDSKDKPRAEETECYSGFGAGAGRDCFGLLGTGGDGNRERLLGTIAGLVRGRIEQQQQGNEGTDL